MIDSFDIAKEITRSRDIIFDAKYRGVWLYGPYEDLAFEWMRYVSSRIQCGMYSSVDFAGDVKNLGSSLKSMTGIEKERIEAFDVYVHEAVKNTNFGQIHNDRFPGFNGAYKSGDIAVVVEGRNRSTNRNNSRSTVNTKTILSTDNDQSQGNDQSRGNGIADLFRDAVEAATGLLNTDGHLVSQVGSIEATAARVSSIFQSLYENGNQHGCLHLTGSKKSKKISQSSGKNMTSHVQSTTSALLQRQQPGNNIKDIAGKTTCSLSTTPLCLKSSKLSTVQQQQRDSLSQPAEKRSPTPTKRDRRSKKVDEQHATVTGKKRGRLSFTPVPTASWLQVDAMRAMSGTSGAAISSQPTLSTDSNACTTTKSCGAVKHEAGISLRADGGGIIDSVWISAGDSVFSGVYPLIAGCRNSTSTSPSGPAYAEREVVYSARIVLLGRNVDLGVFPTEEAAARAHDRALIRAIGPSNCRTTNLNYPITEYACEPLSRFMEFDEKLKAQLFVTAWKGLKHCDFGFLLIRGAQSQGQSHGSSQMHHKALKTDQTLELSGIHNNPQAAAASFDFSRSSTRILEVANSGPLFNVTASGGGSAPPLSSSTPYSSGSLKSKIVNDGEIERSRVSPPSIGSVISVANVPSLSPIVDGINKSGRRRHSKVEKMPLQRAIYLGVHTTPGRCVLGFIGGSRTVAGVTFLKRLPEGIFTRIIACDVSGSHVETDSALLDLYQDVIRNGACDHSPSVPLSAPPTLEKRKVNKEFSLLESSTEQIISPDCQITPETAHSISLSSSLGLGMDGAGSVVESSLHPNNPTPLLSERSSLHTVCDQSACTEEVAVNRADNISCDDTANSYLDDSLDISTETSAVSALVTEPVPSLLAVEPAQEMATTFLSTSAGGKSENEADLIAMSSPVASSTSNPFVSLVSSANIPDLIEPSPSILVQTEEELPQENVAEVKTSASTATQAPNSADMVSKSVIGPDILVQSSSEDGLKEIVCNTILPPPSRPVTLRDLIFGGATYTHTREPTTETVACLPTASNMHIASSICAVLGSEDGAEEIMIDFSSVKATNSQQLCAPESAVIESRDDSKSDKKSHKKRKPESALIDDIDKAVKQKMHMKGEVTKENITLPEGNCKRHNVKVKRDWSSLTNSLPMKREDKVVRGCEKSPVTASLAVAAGAFKPLNAMSVRDPDEGPSTTPIPLMVLAAYRTLPQSELLAQSDQHVNRRSRRSTCLNAANNVEIFIPGTEKHRVYEMTPWACHALGEEARRLRYCLRTSTSSEPNAASIYASCEMYVGTALKAEGWEQSIDKASLRAAGFSPFEVVKQLRSNIIHTLLNGKDGCEGVYTICPNKIFCGVQAADSEITGIDRRVVAVEGSVSETADVATPSATRYVAFDVFATGPRFLGLFNSPLEAALIREQILDRDGRLIRKNFKGCDDRNNTHMENFTSAEWAMLMEMSALMERFIKLHCVVLS